MIGKAPGGEDLTRSSALCWKAARSSKASISAKGKWVHPGSLQKVPKGLEGIEGFVVVGLAKIGSLSQGSLREGLSCSECAMQFLQLQVSLRLESLRSFRFFRFVAV